MRNMPLEEFEKMLVALTTATNIPDEGVEQGRAIGQEWSPAPIEVKLKYLSDIKKLKVWLEQQTFSREVVVFRVLYKVGHWLYSKGIVAQVYDMAAYSQPSVKYELRVTKEGGN